MKLSVKSALRHKNWHYATAPDTNYCHDKRQEFLNQLTIDIYQLIIDYGRNAWHHENNCRNDRNHLSQYSSSLKFKFFVFSRLVM